MPQTVTRTTWPRPLLALLIVTGCVSATGRPEPVRSVEIAPGVAVTLPPTPALGRTVEATQLVTAHYGDRTFVFEGHIAVTPERLLLVGLDTMGRRALTVTWTAEGVAVDAAPWLPDTLRPGNMLADIMMIYWPEAIVRAALTGASLEIRADGGRTVRNSDGTEVVRIDYGASAGAWSGRLHLKNLTWGYDLDIRSEEATP